VPDFLLHFENEAVFLWREGLTPNARIQVVEPSALQHHQKMLGLYAVVTKKGTLM
jgi:hypothetical protein